jgi:TRAP transporter TAXI family solute receptor
MRKYIALSLALCMLLAVTACGGSASKAPAASSAAPAAPASSAAPAAPASSAAPAAPAKPMIMTIGTGDVGGSFYPVGAALAKAVNDHVPGSKVNVETSAGSPDNARNTQSKDIDLGLCTADVALNAMAGEKAFEGKPSPDLRAIFALYGSVAQWLTLSDSGIEYVDDLAGKPASVGMTASATEIAAKAAITAAGISYPDGLKAQFLGIGEGADSVRDGTSIAVTAFGGLPQGGFLDLSATKSVRLLKFKPETLDKILAGNSSYYKAKLPLDVYKVVNTEPVETFGVKALVIVHADMSEEAAYNITKACLDNIPELIAGHASLKAMEDINFVTTDLAIPVHPGAEKYFKEKGYI